MSENGKQMSSKANSIVNFTTQDTDEIVFYIKLKKLEGTFKEEARQWKSRELEEELAKQRKLKEFEDKLEGKGLTEEDKEEGITIPIEFDGGLTKDVLHL